MPVRRSSDHPSFFHGDARSLQASLRVGRRIEGTGAKPPVRQSLKGPKMYLQLPKQSLLAGYLEALYKDLQQETTKIMASVVNGRPVLTFQLVCGPWPPKASKTPLSDATHIAHGALSML